MGFVLEKVIVRFDNSIDVIGRVAHCVRSVKFQSRASLVPAAAVTPAGRATDNFAAVETFVAAPFFVGPFEAVKEPLNHLRRKETDRLYVMVALTSW